MIYEIPLQPGTPQTFLVTLAGREYRFRLVFRSAIGAAELGGWVLDISATDESAILSGLPLVAGADLLAGHAHLGFGGALVVYTDGDPWAAPTFDGLGVLSRLYFVTPE